MKSRGYVKENFSWQHYYWFLTDEGITYLQEYLNLPPSVQPKSMIAKNANE